MGSRFIAVEESPAEQEYKDLVVEVDLNDII